MSEITQSLNGAAQPFVLNNTLANVARMTATETIEAVITKVEVSNLSFYYGKFQALRNLNLSIPARRITAIIGPSGSGKSTFLRLLNRMSDLTPGSRAEGQIIFEDQNILDPAIDLVKLRNKVGMVFQKPNPFPKSIFDNITYAPKASGIRDKKALEELVERSLRSASLWEEVKDKLDKSGYSLSGGQQQRLCIARAIATRPEVILMDEPCSALDPISTIKIEELMLELRKHFTIVIVTHNMQQAARASDFTAVFMMGSDRAGEMVEAGRTRDVFSQPKNERTEQYITGRFG